LTERLFEESGPTAVLRASAGKRALATLQGKLAVNPGELEVMVNRVLQAFLSDFGAGWLKDGRVAKERVLSLPITGV
jgi:hypothetical protein